VDHAGAAGGEGEGIDDQLGLPVLLEVKGDQLVLGELLPTLGGNAEDTGAALFTLLSVADSHPDHLPHVVEPVHDELLLVVHVGRHPWCHHLLSAWAGFVPLLKSLEPADDIICRDLVSKDGQQVFLPLQSFSDELSWVASRWTVAERRISTLGGQARDSDIFVLTTVCIRVLYGSPNAIPPSP